MFRPAVEELETRLAPANSNGVISIVSITNDTIGLDSNKPTTQGPDTFLIGARVTNIGTTTLTNVIASFVWDGPVVGGAATSIVLLPTANGGTNTLVTATLAPGQSTDFYFDVKIDRVSAPYGATRPYEIDATADQSPSTINTDFAATTEPTPAGVHRQVIVQRLNSQNRNSVDGITITGPDISPISVGATGSANINLTIGQTYTVTLYTSTTPGGYTELEHEINFPNAVFQILSASSTFVNQGTNGLGNNSVYADAGGLNLNPASGSYGAVVGAAAPFYPVDDPQYDAAFGGKVGGQVVTVFQVKIAQAASNMSLEGLILDVSGGSEHYDGGIGSGPQLTVNTVTAQSNVFTWNGGCASSTNWSQAANWTNSANKAPAIGDLGDILIFPELTAGKQVSTNDLNLTGSQVSQIVFTGSGYNLSNGAGGGLNVSGSITSTNAAGSNTISAALTLGGSLTVGAEIAGTTLNFAGTVNNSGNLITVTGAGLTDFTSTAVISGSGGLTMSGFGTVKLDGANSYTGTTTAAYGTILVNGNVPSTSGVGNNGPLGNASSAVQVGNAIATLATTTSTATISTATIASRATGVSASEDTVTGATGSASGTTVTVNITGTNPFSVGETITVSGFSNGGNYNGTFTIDNVTNSTITYTDTLGTLAATDSGGKVVGSLVTITGYSGTLFTAGQTVTVTGFNGGNPAATNYNGTFTVNSGGSGSFTYFNTNAISSGIGSANNGVVNSALVTVTTTALASPQPVAVGDTVVITTPAAGYSGTFTVTSVSGLTFTYIDKNTTITATSSSGGSVSDTSGGASEVGNICTITTSAANNFSVGQTVTINTPVSGYNGTFTIYQVLSPTKFTYINSLNTGLNNTNSGTAEVDGSASLLVNGGFTFGRNITVQSGSAGTKTIGEASTGGTANFNGTIALGDNGTLTAASGGTAVFNGVISGAGTLTAQGVDTTSIMNLTAANSYTGATTVAEGILSFSGAGTDTGGTGGTGSTSFIVNNGGTLTLDNSASTNTNRIVDTATLTMNGGTFSFKGLNNGASTETIGGVTLANGFSTIQSVNNGTGTAAVTFASLTRNANAGLANFSDNGLNNLGTASNKIVFSSAPTVTNGILAGAYATVDGTDWATHGANGIAALASGSYTTMPANASGGAASTNYVVNSAVTLSGALVANTIKIAAGGSINLNGFSLTVGTTSGAVGGGLLTTGNTSASINGGTLAFNTEATIFNNLAADNESIGATITGSGGLTVGGNGKLTLTNTGNSFTGNVNLYGGTTILSSASTIVIPATGASLIGGGAITLNGGNLTLNGPLAGTTSLARTITFGLGGGTLDLGGSTANSLSSSFTPAGFVINAASGTQAVIADETLASNWSAASALNIGTTALAQATATISSATESGTTVTITTSAANIFSIGQTVVISGVGVTGYNGTFTITNIVDSTHFQYTNTKTSLASSSGGTVSGSGALQFNLTNGALLQDAQANYTGSLTFSGTSTGNTTGGSTANNTGRLAFNPVLSITSATVGNKTINGITSNYATITTSGVNGFQVGDTVVVSGVGVANYNGTFTIAAVTSNTFSYIMPFTTLATSSGGTATDDVSVTGGMFFKNVMEVTEAVANVTLNTNITILSGTTAFQGLGGTSTAVTSPLTIGSAGTGELLTVNSGATLILDNEFRTPTSDVTWSNGDLVNSNVLLNSGATLQFSQTNATGIQSQTQVLGGIGGAGGVSVTNDSGVSTGGLGTYTVLGGNTYSGDTTINAGTFQAGAVDTFSPNSAILMANLSSAILNLNNFSQGIAALSNMGSYEGVSSAIVKLGSGELTTGLVDNYGSTTTGTPGSVVFGGIIQGAPVSTNIVANNTDSATISTVTEVGNTVSVTTTTALNLSVGQTVTMTMTGGTGPAHSGSFVVESITDSTHFKYFDQSTGLTGVTSGSVQYTGRSGATVSGTTVTITTSTAHNLAVGEDILISGFTGGATGLNGEFEVASVTSPTTFTYVDTAAGLPSTAGGGNVSAGGSLDKDGLGTFYLENPGSTYTGLTIICGGILTADASGACGNSSIAVAPGIYVDAGASFGIDPGINYNTGETLNLTGLGLPDVNNPNLVGQGALMLYGGMFTGTITLLSDSCIETTLGPNALNGSINLNGHTLYECEDGVGDSSMVINSVISGSGGVNGALVKGLPVNFLGNAPDTGPLTLTAANTYTGTTTVNSGELIVDGSITSNVTVNNTPATISLASETAGGTVTITTSAANYFAAGDTVIISGVGVANGNGTFKITSVLSSTQFTYQLAVGTAGSSSGAGAKAQVISPSAAGGTVGGTGTITGSISGTGTVSPGGTVTSASISTATAVGTLVTITTTAPNSFANNDMVSISGVTNTNYNGIFQITVLNSTQFTYTDTNGGLTSSGGGTAIDLALEQTSGVSTVGTLTASSLSMTGGGTLYMQAAGTKTSPSADKLALTGGMTLTGNNNLFFDLSGLKPGTTGNTGTLTINPLVSYGSFSGTFSSISNLPSSFAPPSPSYSGGPSTAGALSVDIGNVAVTNVPNAGGTGGIPNIGLVPSKNQPTSSQPVIIASLDTGIDFSDPQIAAHIWINQAAIPDSVRTLLGNGIITFADLDAHISQLKGLDHGNKGYIDAADLLMPIAQGGWSTGPQDDIVGWNFVANNNNPFDDNGHGTAQAGILAALAPNVFIMPVKVLDSYGVGSFDQVTAGLEYAISHGAKVVSDAWAAAAVSDEWMQALEDAQAAGVIVVTSAGNGNANDLYVLSQEQLSNVVVVGASDGKDKLASFSNTSSDVVDITAPGVGIITTAPGGGYTTVSGTSVSTAFVAATVGLIESGAPNLSPTDVINALYSGANQLSGLLGGVSEGRRLNITGALESAGVLPPGTEFFSRSFPGQLYNPNPGLPPGNDRSLSELAQVLAMMASGNDSGPPSFTPPGQNTSSDGPGASGSHSAIRDGLTSGDSKGSHANLDPLGEDEAPPELKDLDAFFADLAQNPAVPTDEPSGEKVANR